LKVVIRLLILFSGTMTTVLASQAATFYSTQTTWQATTVESVWIGLSRERLLDGEAAGFKPGSSMLTVSNALGAPQSEWKMDGKTLWTYGL
jgi:hypothetical protein